NTVQCVSYTRADGTPVAFLDEDDMSSDDASSTASQQSIKAYVDAAGGGITSISNTAITAITNIDVTGFVSGTYDNYEVWISNGQPGNDGVLLEMETSTDGSSTFDVGASDYTWAMLTVDEAGSTLPVADNDDTEININGNVSVGNAANENLSVKISVFSPETTEFTVFTWAGLFRGTTTGGTMFNGGGDRQSAADVDALRFHWSAGDWVAQGAIQFLGIAQ
ncbi:hypothetical protein LCGC14_3130560, partial [marine sediment metagenome]